MSTNNSFSCRNKTKYTLYRAMQSAIHICIHDYIITVSLISSLVNVSRAKTCLRVYADSKGPDQTAHLIRAFAICEQNHLTLLDVSKESKCPNEALQVCMLEDISRVECKTIVTQTYF